MPLFRPRRCQICTTPLRRSAYVWESSGHTVYVCPKCNTRLETMKSRAAFDPSKPFVFPPIIKSANSPGCSALVVGAVVVIIMIAVIGGLNPTRTVPSSPEAPSTSALSSTNVTPTLPVPAQETNLVVAPPPEPPPEIGSSVMLRDAARLPVTIIISKRVDIVTSSGGFGLDPGEELLVVSKDASGAYVVDRRGQQFTVAAYLIEDMKTK